MTDQMPKLDRAKLRQQVLAEVDCLIEQVADAVDGARPGRVIADSEEKVRDILDRFRQKTYQLALQGRVDAAEAAFPPSGQRGDRQAQTP